MTNVPGKAPDARALLRKYGLRAKKSWGQNFLVDDRTYDRIVDAARLAPGEFVVEIGAGLGTLTARLAARCARVFAVERDRDLAAVLRGEHSEDPAIAVLEENALTLDYASLAASAGQKLVVIGNLPYQIASPLLFQLIAARAHWSRALVMLQLEMARRIVASPATPDYGSLGVGLSTYARPELCFKVGRSAFLPAPRVDSAIVRLTPRATSEIAVRDPEQYERLVRSAFGQRRKMLRNALEGILPDDALGEALREAEIDGQRRGETLSVAEFQRLHEMIMRRAVA